MVEKHIMVISDGNLFLLQTLPSTGSSDQNLWTSRNHDMAPHLIQSKKGLILSCTNVCEVKQYTMLRRSKYHPLFHRQCARMRQMPFWHVLITRILLCTQPLTFLRREMNMLSFIQLQDVLETNLATMREHNCKIPVFYLVYSDHE
jgi:hypothetical protein